MVHKELRHLAHDGNALRRVVDACAAVRWEERAAVRWEERCAWSEGDGWRGRGWTFFRIPLELVLLRVPLRCVNRDEFALDRTDESLASPEKCVTLDHSNGISKCVQHAPVDVGGENVEGGGQTVIGGEGVGCDSEVMIVHCNGCDIWLVRCEKGGVEGVRKSTVIAECRHA